MSVISKKTNSSSAKTSHPKPLPKPGNSPPPLPRRKPAQSGGPDKVDLSRETQETAASANPIVGAMAENYKVYENPEIGKHTAFAVKRMQTVLRKEHQRFGGAYKVERGKKPLTRSERKLNKRGIREDDKRVYKRVGDYYKSVGEKYDGKDRKVPWSAAFISHTHEQAGVGAQFKKSPYHSKYIHDAIRAKKVGDKHAAYWGHRSTERAPKVGDMLAYARRVKKGAWKGRKATYDRQYRGYYPSHTDIVSKVGNGYVEVTGGNIGDSVTVRRVPTTTKGLLFNKRKYFAVLEPKNLSP